VKPERVETKGEKTQIKMVTCSSINDTVGICSTLESSGTGLGVFLSAIQSPLVAFILVIGIIGGIIGIFVAVGSVIKNSMHKYK